MESFTTHIKSNIGWLDIDFHELWRYRDLIFLFFKRNYTTRYKQTILGPLWLIFNPLMTVSLYATIFGNLAGLSSDKVPHFVFYLCSNALWTFFSSSLAQTANTFTANAAIMGKVYFPRLVMPLSAVLTGLLDLSIQLAMLFFVMVGYSISGVHFQLGSALFLAPVLVLQTGLFSFACGIIIAALTTKYRDLAVLVDFGTKLWMYATPVVYTVALIPEKYVNIYMLNPMSPIMECWRHAVIGTGVFLGKPWALSLVITFFVLMIGIMLFNKIEKTFMDTV